jgi:hypothetical protein
VADVTAVTVTYNGLPWIEQCLESLRAVETVLVDHGSTDGTLELVRRRFPEVRVIAQGNSGLGAGLNAGMLAALPLHLLINSDAWLVENALERLVAFADAREDAAVVAPRLRNPDGTLQRSVRGFPRSGGSPQYFFLRKLAPRSHAFNAYYAGDFDHGSARSVEWVMGSCFLVCRAAADQVGMFGEDFFLFSEETDWLYRFHQAGWTVSSRRMPRPCTSRRFPAGVWPSRTFAGWCAGSPSTEALRRQPARVGCRGGAAAARTGLPRRTRPAVPRRSPRALMRRIREAARPAGARDLPCAAGHRLGPVGAARGGDRVPAAAGRARACVEVRLFSAVLAWSLGAIFVAMALVFLVHASLTLALILLALIAAGTSRGSRLGR